MEEEKVKISDLLIRVKKKDTGEEGWIDGDEIIDGFRESAIEVFLK